MLDSNVFTHVANRADGHDLIEMHMARVGLRACCMSSITAWEIAHMQFKGVGKIKQLSLAALASALNMVSVLEYDKTDAVNGGAIQDYMTRHGMALGERDAMIVGHAMARGLVLVSDDRHMGTVPLLKLENWRVRVALAPER